MDELNEMTMVDESPVTVSSEPNINEVEDIRYVDAGVVCAGGAIVGILAWELGRAILNCKPVQSACTATANGVKKAYGGIRNLVTGNSRKKLAKLENEVVDVEVIPEKDAVNE